MNKFLNSGNTKELFEQEVDVLEKPTNDLIIYNDDVNTFDHVIDCLVKICKHEVHQAEQSALIIHHNGKCAVKNGEFEKLKPMCISLLDNGLNATIE